MNSRNSIPDLSYYRLMLADFLRESYPERINDDKFITERSEAAAAIYTQVILNGDNTDEAIDHANVVLYQGLHFSKLNTIVNILWNEFTNEVPEEIATGLAIKLLPECEQIFAKYPLIDDFAYEPEYEFLYTELTGAITLLIETRDWQKTNIVS